MIVEDNASENNVMSYNGCGDLVTSEPVREAGSWPSSFIGPECRSWHFNSSTQDVSMHWSWFRLPVRFCVEPYADGHKSVFWG